MTPRRSPVPAEPVLDLGRARDWAKWLAAHHASSTGVLLRIAKRRPGAAGRRRRSPTPRRSTSRSPGAGSTARSARSTRPRGCSASRRARRRARGRRSTARKAEALIAAGTMQPPGLAEVERAKRDGRWERAYDGARTSAVPDGSRLRARAERPRPRLLRGARRREPLRHPLPGADREEAGDARRAHRALRRDVRAARDASPAASPVVTGRGGGRSRWSLRSLSRPPLNASIVGRTGGAVETRGGFDCQPDNGLLAHHEPRRRPKARCSASESDRCLRSCRACLLEGAPGWPRQNRL